MQETPENDCGEPCAALSEREHRFHLLILAGASAARAYVDTAAEGKKPKRKSAETHGPRMVRSGQVQAALAHHRAIESVRYRATKDRQVERLAALAEGATVERFATVEGGELILHDWREIPPDLLRGVARIERTEKADGSVSIKLRMRDPVAAERELAALLGHRAPEKHEVAIDDAAAAREKIAEAIARRAAAKNCGTHAGRR